MLRNPLSLGGVPRRARPNCLWPALPQRRTACASSRIDETWEPPTSLHAATPAGVHCERLVVASYGLRGGGGCQTFLRAPPQQRSRTRLLPVIGLWADPKGPRFPGITRCEAPLERAL